MKERPIFTLRRAISTDFDFIWQLRLLTMKSIISRSYGWHEPTQREYAAESLNGNIVIVENNKAGVITISDWQDQLHLTFIALLPQYQGSGLGTELINYAKNRASEEGKPLTLQVLKDNPVKLFYEKQGFQIGDRNGVEKLLMRWQPDATSDNYKIN